MQRLVVPLLVLLCAAAASADFADDIYAGSLAPFSYAELQAEMTPSTPYAPGSTVFLAPESLLETRAAASAYAAAQAQAQARQASLSQPVAFPFQSPPLPADLNGASAYAPSIFAQNPMLQNLASTVDAAIANAPSPLLLEAQSAIRSSPSAQSDDDMGDILAAERTSTLRPMPNMRLSQLSQISSGSQLPPPALSGSSIMSGLSSAPGSSIPVPASASSAAPASSGSGLPSISSALSSLSTPSSASQPSTGSSSSSRSGSGSVTPIAHAKKKHRCVPKGNNGCVVDIDPRSVHWSVVTVPRGTFAAESAGSEESSRAFESSRSASASSQSALVGESAFQQEYSENPTIAAAQKQFYDKQAELMREKRWIADVKKIIDEYQNKVKNVQRHTTIEEMALAKSRKNVVNMIKAEKAKKLEGELRAALDSLKKLETTSQALNSKMGELKQTKQGLQSTISKIQRVIGGKATGMSLVETAEDVTDAQKSDANDSAKQLFASLIQLVSKAQQTTTEKERALHQAYSDHHVAPHSRQSAPMHTHGAHLRALNARERHNNGEDVDLMEIESKAHSIANKYVDEENERLHMSFPLETLALRDMRKANDDDLFLDF